MAASRGHCSMSRISSSSRNAAPLWRCKRHCRGLEPPSWVLVPGVCELFSKTAGTFMHVHVLFVSRGTMSQHRMTAAGHCRHNHQKAHPTHTRRVVAPAAMRASGVMMPVIECHGALAGAEPGCAVCAQAMALPTSRSEKTTSCRLGGSARTLSSHTWRCAASLCCCAVVLQRDVLCRVRFDRGTSGPAPSFRHRVRYKRCRRWLSNKGRACRRTFCCCGAGAPRAAGAARRHRTGRAAAAPGMPT